MFRKTMLMSALCISTLSLSGCSSMWSAVGSFSDDMAEFTKFSFLRGPSKKTDVSFADAAPSAEGTYVTEAGAYIPANVEIYSDSASVIDTSPVPCPEGTYLNAENACMYLETEQYEFADDVNMVEQVIDTSPIPCPDGTYLNAENACMYLEVEEYDFQDEVNMTEQVIDTSPVPCPEGTYLNAENACMYLETEALDFAVNPAPEAAQPSFDFVTNQSSDCPEGFTLNADNTCMYLGAELSLKP